MQHYPGITNTDDADEDGLGNTQEHHQYSSSHEPEHLYKQNVQLGNGSRDLYADQRTRDNTDEY